MMGFFGCWEFLIILHGRSAFGYLSFFWKFLGTELFFAVAFLASRIFRMLEYLNFKLI